jgi:AcrR family transcriptional regulator
MVGDVRSAVVSAATRLFAARGFDGTALQEIADAVGVTKPAVLHHFGSKEQIREAVLGDIVAHWNETLPRLLQAATAATDRFAAVVGELHRFFTADPDRARLVVREALDRPAEMKKLLRGAVRPWLQAIAEYIRVGQANGSHYADVDPEAYVIHALLAVINAAAGAPVLLAALDGPADEARARYDRELVRMVRASLFVPPAARSSQAKNRNANKRR